jgi:hypothetical protein
MSDFPGLPSVTGGMLPICYPGPPMNSTRSAWPAFMSECKIAAPGHYDSPGGQADS